MNRPDDNELCGFVEERPDGWHALTVFGASLGVHQVVLDHYALPGVPTLRIDRLQLDAQRWTLRLNR